MKTIVLNPWKIRIGERTIINEYCFIDGRGGLRIGSDVSISVYSSILTGTHETDSNEFKYKKQKVIIEDNAWIGMKATILEGTHIEEGAVIGANSVIKKFAKSYTVYAGIPAKELKKRQISEKYKIHNITFFR